MTFLIVAASSFSGLRSWADAGENPILPTLLLAIALLVAAGLALWRLLMILRFDQVGSACATALFLLVATNTGGLVGQYHTLDRLGLLLLAIGMGAIAYRLHRLPAFRLLMTWLALFLVASPMVNIIGRTAASGELNVDTAPAVIAIEMTEKPDILVVFFDAYGSREVLEEFYGFDNSQVLGELESRGFEAPGTVSANYARTQLSIPSFLQLDYVSGASDITDADVDGLLQVMSGGNTLSRTLRSQGYRHVFVESGWLGTKCGATVDICVTSPWPDETFYDVAYRTILRDMPGFELGRSFTNGALHATEWLTGDLSSYLDDEHPDFIFAHVLLPHPPLFLDDQCAPDWRGGLPGFAIGRPEANELEEAAAEADYVNQVQCVNSILVRIADMLKPGDVALLMGDHGPDIQGQLFLPSSRWSGDQLRERFGTFIAAKVPGCDMAEIESLVNVGRRMLACLSGQPLPDLPTRTFDLQRTPNGNAIRELEVPSW